MSQTYSQRYPHGGSLEMEELIELRGEQPVFVQAENVSHDASELWEFDDGTRVITTNGGIMTEYSKGFENEVARILAD
jgi:hypothetical protein